MSREMTFYTSVQDTEDWRRLPNNKKKPFIHKFQTESVKYIYDVNTGRIVRVDDILWEIVDYYGVVDRDELIDMFGEKHGRQNVAQFYDEIHIAQETQCLFRADYPALSDITFHRTKKQLAEGSVSRKRKLLTLCVTQACNFRCSYCIYGGRYKEWRTHSNKHLSEDIAIAAISDYLRHSEYAEEGEPRTIAFYGGEPLIRMQLIKKCVEFVSEQEGTDDVGFDVATNGYNLIDDVGDFLASKGFHIQVSLDGPANIHDRYRVHLNSTTTYSKICENLERFLCRHPEYRSNESLSINATIAPTSDVREVYQFFNSNEFQFRDDKMQIKFNVADLTGYPEYTKTATSWCNVVPGYNQLHNTFLNCCVKSGTNLLSRSWMILFSLYGMDYLDLHRRRVAPSGKSLSIKPYGPQTSLCIPGARRLFVDVNGDYYICEQVPTIEKFRIGNYKTGVDTIKAYEMAEEFMRISRENCIRCWCVHNCQIGCFSRSELLDKDKRDEYCALYRRDFHHKLIRYCKVLETNPHAFDKFNDGEGRDIILSDMTEITD